MAKYEVIDLLWSKSKNKYIQPGEIVELGDEIAQILLRKKAIKPARYVPKKRASRKLKVSKLDKEKGNGTN